MIALAGAGDHIVASSRLYGGTRTLLDVTLRRLGIETTFVDGDDVAAYAAALTPRTRAVYAEVIGNPSGAIADLEGLAALARRHAPTSVGIAYTGDDPMGALDRVAATAQCFRYALA